MKYKTPHLTQNQKLFELSKEKILHDWLSYASPKEILLQHKIDADKFLHDYADGVFDYFMDVISCEAEVGDCPIMHTLLSYFKHSKITADELFEICSHFRRSMIHFSYEIKIDSKELFDEISYIFDKNFRGILRYYTDTIFQKEQEINRNTKLLSEYKKALDASALIAKTNLNGTLIYVNHKLVELCGYSESELIGKQYDIFRHEDMYKNAIDDIFIELKNKKFYKGKLKNRKKNGDYFYVDTTIVEIHDPQENVAEYMFIAYDITTLVDAKTKALHASQAKEYFLSNMSHEIRTPLNAILGFVTLLLDESVSKKHRSYLDIILNSGENLLTIINDILDFSKLRSGEFTIEPKTFSVHDELSHTMELFVASASSKNITITSFMDPEIPKEIYADALRIKQILSNFLSNAIKFTPYGGIISVEVRCKENILYISVTDNGKGISKENIENIFVAFAQAQDNGLKDSDGTGLGLSISHQLTKHMNGHIKVESTLGKGSKFWVEIPVEILDTMCPLLEDMSAFTSLKIVIYSKEKKRLFEHDSFLKYANIFGMQIEIVDSLDVSFDIAIFVDAELTKELKNKIIKSDKKFIALMNKQSDYYDKHQHISTMCFPLYCSKIKASFSELLNPDSYLPHLKKQNIKFIGHILVAEDNEANQELIKIILAKYGLTFDVVENGYEAVEIYKLNHYDLILMDEQMPIMDGNKAVVEILKYEKIKGLRHTPVSALTANVIKGAKERGLKSGFDSFLGKPIVLKELERVFKTYLKEDSSATLEESVQASSGHKIVGLDTKKLTEELLLDEDDLVMLINLYIKKMLSLLPELKAYIESKNYKKIALLAHSIKGSSGNFRIEVLQDKAGEMEMMAKEKKSDYDYESVFEIIQSRIQEIYVS